MRRLGLVVFLAACTSNHGNYKPPPTMPTANDVVKKLTDTAAARTSFSAETLMDYWLGKQRLKGEVLVMGTSARQVRFNANDPTGSVIADMACNGQDFAYVDMRNNCQLTGPCNKQSIATFLHVPLEPEDFLHFALGTPPVDPGSTGTVEWDGAHGYEKVTLQSPRGTQKLVIDAKDNRYDVVSAKVVDPGGKVVWSVENTDFQSYKDANGAEHRLPGATHFKSPVQEADLKVEWKQRVVNPSIAPTKFNVPIPEGLPRCP